MEMEKESFALQFVGRQLDLNSAAAMAKANPLHAKLIAEARRVKDIPGALYLATEAMPFDVLSGNYKRTPFNAQSKTFAATAVTPYYKPILYSHEDGGGGMFAPGVKPQIAGRIFSSMIADNGRGGKSIFTGQAVTDKESIDRVNSFIDYSQSIAFYPQSYTCDVCGEDPMHGCGLDESASRCYNLGKEVSAPDGSKSKKKKMVTWSVLPDRIAEISFVAIPAYPDAMVLGIEQNSLGQSLIRGGALDAYYAYVKKEGFISLNDLPDRPDNQNGSQELPAGQKSGTIGSESNQEQNDMELKEEFEKLKKELNEAIERIEKNVKAIADKSQVSAEDLAKQKAVDEANKKAQEEAERNANQASEKDQVVAKALADVQEQNKKTAELCSELSNKIDQFLKNGLQAPKTEAEIEAEKKAADEKAAQEAAQAAEKAAADKAAADKIEADRKAAEEAEKNRQNAKKGIPNGPFSKSLLNR